MTTAPHRTEQEDSQTSVEVTVAWYSRPPHHDFCTEHNLRVVCPRLFTWSNIQYDSVGIKLAGVTQTSLGWTNKMKPEQINTLRPDATPSSHQIDCFSMLFWAPKSTAPSSASQMDNLYMIVGIAYFWQARSQHINQHPQHRLNNSKPSKANINMML